MNMPGFTAVSSLLQTNNSFYSDNHYTLTDGSVYLAACDNACYTQCHSFCGPDCSDLTGASKGACLRFCARDCRRDCGCGR
jgi:hypothetical protein